MNLKKVKTFEELKIAKSNFYSKEGKLKKLQEEIKNSSPQRKKELGKIISDLKNNAKKIFDEKAKEIENNIIEEKIKNEWIDVTYPITKNGGLHPLSIIANRFRDWLLQNGYFETTGSEIESNEYNFERLNIEKDHPARDMQDSLYINSNTLLRTHNTGFTARELEKNPNKAFSHFTIGKVYRNDKDDSIHSHQFMQVDILNVGNISFSNLIWTLKSLISYVLNKKIKIRLRPSFFPFTEPSLEIDIYYNNKWIEILGAGILNEKVLKIAGYTNDMNAFAAGISIERIAMIKYQIEDIREFYKNDLRFLSQFKGVN